MTTSHEETTVTQPERFSTIQIDCIDIRTGDRFRKIDGVFRNTVKRVEIIDDEYVSVWIEGQEKNAGPWLTFTGIDKITVQRSVEPAPDEMFDRIDATDAAREQFERDPQNAGSVGPARTPVGTVLSEPDVSYDVRDQFPTMPARTPRLSADIIARIRALRAEYRNSVGTSMNLVQARDAVLAGCVTLDDFTQWVSKRMTERRKAAGPHESCQVGPITVDVLGPWDNPEFEIGVWSNAEGTFVHGLTLTREEADALHTALGRMLLG
jgi:hypothetical protein